MHDFKGIYSAAHNLGLPETGWTMGDCIELATQLGCRVSEVILAEASRQSGLDRDQVIGRVIGAYEHNLHAAEVGAASGQSFIMGTVGRELSASGAPVLIDDAFVNTILVHTLSAQVGNHEVGLQPCAGTGDSCPYTGFVKAMMLRGADRESLGRVAAVINKVGSLFRVGKTTSGCNMEGFGAGGAALAAAFVELENGAPEQMGHAITLAVSPTIAVPCTPRVMVPGLCATHIGAAVLVARLAASLAMRTKTLNVTVPVDVMLAMASAVHPVSAAHVVPEVIRYMEPFFKTHPGVENFIEPAIKAEEKKRIDDILKQAKAEARAQAAASRCIVDPFGLAVVGGSSQAVGSPTNAGRIAYLLARKKNLGKPSKVLIELYPELFARRGINVPGIVMAAVYGADTSDGALYREAMDRAKADKIDVEIRCVSDKPQLQRVTLFFAGGEVVVDAQNRGGGRLALVDSNLGLEAARVAAEELGIDVVN